MLVVKINRLTIVWFKARSPFVLKHTTSIVVIGVGVLFNDNYLAWMVYRTNVPNTGLIWMTPSRVEVFMSALS